MPVLLVSAARDEHLEALARDLGAAAWLAKPFGIDELVAAVGQLTGR